jgi:hypothetical protein
MKWKEVNGGRVEEAIFRTKKAAVTMTSELQES